MRKMILSFITLVYDYVWARCKKKKNMEIILSIILLIPRIIFPVYTNRDYTREREHIWTYITTYDEFLFSDRLSLSTC